MGEYANKAIGYTKKTVGKLTGNRTLQAKGTAQFYGGKVQGGAKRVGRRVKRASAGIRRKAASRPVSRSRPTRSRTTVRARRY